MKFEPYCSSSRAENAAEMPLTAAPIIPRVSCRILVRLQNKFQVSSSYRSRDILFTEEFKASAMSPFIPMVDDALDIDIGIRALNDG
ncbi:hypothetical protein M8J77_023153 [Diaphorina citri]|nr:hypothetical protein M8J77_023153 [Diaphorina citri]